MSQAREIRTKISSIKNTQKITHAMELVAVSKMRKAQQRMTMARPYARKIRQVIKHVAASHSEYRHPYLENRKEIKAVGYIVITSDRGLCGGLNINLFRALLLDMQQWQQKNVAVNLCLIGKKGELFFKRFGGKVLAVAEHLGDAPKIQDLIGVVKVMLDHYDEGKLDAIYIVSNEFVSTMKQQPRIKQLLPLPLDENAPESSGHWDYIYEPDTSKNLLSMLLIRYFESQVYRSVVENIACFQAAQMIAMKNATENAGELIKDLQLIYNKARQAGITREIAEIVAGAAAVE